MIRHIVSEITSRILDLAFLFFDQDRFNNRVHIFFSFQIANNITLSFANAHSRMILFAICKKKNMHSIINRSGSNKNAKSKIRDVISLTMAYYPIKSLNFKKIFIRERITWKSASTQRSSEKKLLRFFSCLSSSKK